MDWRVDWELSQQVIRAAFDTHRELGPGLLERVYEECFCWHLTKMQIVHVRQLAIPMTFQDKVIAGAFTLDVVVEKKLIVEIKSVERVHSITRSQLITYLKMTGMRSGLLINFNTDPLNDGIQRVVNPH